MNEDDVENTDIILEERRNPIVEKNVSDYCCSTYACFLFSQ